MQNAIISLCKALGQLLDAHYTTYDASTSRLLRALIDYINAHKE